MTADVVGVMDYLAIPRAAVVGWSDGGIIGIKMAIDHPDRISSLVSLGANVDSSGVDAQAFDESIVGKKYFDRITREYAALSPAPEQGEFFRKQIFEMWEKEPRISAEELGKIKIPVLILHGEHDEGILRKHAKYIANQIPGGVFRELKNVSHFAFLQNPEIFNEPMQKFLSSPPTFGMQHPLQDNLG
jgi:pimeloyl-ACP methyl ester carboxylesterase